MKAVALNDEEFPGRIAHGAAWRYFLKTLRGKSYTPEHMICAWAHFLDGWKAKGVATDIIHGKRK